MAADRDVEGRRLYKARGPDGEEAWVDHDGLWRLQQRQVEEARRGQARRRRLLLAGLFALVGIALVLGLWLGRPGGPAAAPAAGPPSAAAIPADPSTPSPAPAAGDVPRAASKPVAPPPEQRVRDAIRAWAEAWRSQDVAAYLASYAASFEPADGLSREAWERLRRQRLEEPESIRLEIEDLEVAPLEDGRARATFRQLYASPTYSDLVRKTLDLVEEDGGWRIAGERAEPIPAGG